MVIIGGLNFQMRKLKPQKVKICPRLVRLKPWARFHVPSPLTKAPVLTVSRENNVIRDWHFMEALDHVPLEAAAVNGLCSTYLM